MPSAHAVAHRRFRVGATLGLVAALATHTLHAQSCAPLRTGLVLSGGGAKGYAHIGVFRILDSLHIKPDFIVGSSIGAIGGALYASGYSGAEIDSLLRALPVASVIRSYSPQAPGVLGALPAIAVWENDGRGFALQTGSVREPEVNALMSALMLRGNLEARGDFDRMMIPMRVIATRLSTRQTVVLSHGDLAQAVRASFAIPLVFAPGVVGNEVLVDGGVSDNIPVSTALAMGAERLIISTLSSATVSDELLGDPLKMALQLTDYLFRTDTTGIRPQDIVIRNRTTDVSSLDFSTATMDSLVTSGMEVARTAFASAGCVRTQRDARTAAVPVQPPLTLTDITVSSPRALEQQTLRLALGLRVGHRVSEDSLRTRLLQLGSSNDYRALWLTPSGRDTTLALHVTPVYTAKQVIVVGLAYDNDLGGRLWGGIAWRDLFSAAVEAASALDIGKYRQEFRAGLRRRIPAFQHAAPLVASFRTVSEDIRIYTDSGELAPRGTRDVSVAIGASAIIAGGYTLDVTPTFRWWSGDAQPSLGALGLSVRLADGAHRTDARTILDAEANARYQRAHVETKRQWTVGTVDITSRARLSWSHAAPLQQQFTLGGIDGFAGLHSTERRGDQEAMASIGIARPVFGPIRGVADVMVGAMGSGSGFLQRRDGSTFGQVLTGGRLGGEVQTSVLTVRVQRGVNSAHGDVWFIRFGQWF
jgi:NTE family protein